MLRLANDELSWLLGRGYTMTASLKLVGDRHGLAARQRLALQRAACSDQQRERRLLHGLRVEDAFGQRLLVDGFNLIITLEAALSGGLLIRARDHAIRDLSGVHGSYRAVAETERAVCLVGRALEAICPESVRWLLDRPISNSGRLAQRIRHLAVQYNWPWTVETVFNPDTIIKSSLEVAVTSDSTILDEVKTWINLADYVVRHYVEEPWMIDLS